MTLVDDDFTPEEVLCPSCEGLKDDLHNERQRADELSDELSRLKDGEGDEIIISVDDYNELTELKEIVDELKVIKERISLGVLSGTVEYEKLLERLLT